jgi:hypothetical protein
MVNEIVSDHWPVIGLNMGAQAGEPPKAAISVEVIMEDLGYKWNMLSTNTDLIFSFFSGRWEGRK